MLEKEQIELMEQRIQRFNEFVMSQDIEKMPVGLFSGKMGLCIYFYQQSRLVENKRYMSYAEKILDSILLEINTKTLINIEDGLIGICLGLHYLVDNGFKKGNLNYILSELDDKIYKVAWFDLLKNESSSKDLVYYVLQVALYFVIRLENKKLSSANRFVFESIVIKSINRIEMTCNLNDLISEPPLFSLNQYHIVTYLYVLIRVYRLKFYNYKIIKVFDEISLKLFSSYPLLQSNRLQLISVLDMLNSEISNKKYLDYTNRLKIDIDLDKMIKSEFKSRNLFLNNGLCGLYLIQGMLFKNRNLNESLIIEKITRSELWNDIDREYKSIEINEGLFTGIAGIVIIYLKLMSGK